jgi:hypothetical protein
MHRPLARALALLCPTATVAIVAQLAACQTSSVASDADFTALTPAVMPPLATAPRSWDFAGTADGTPAGFHVGRTGGGAPVRWLIRRDPAGVIGSGLLVQDDSDRTGSRFALAVADSPSFRDVRLSVRCRPESGRVDRACGIVWRYQDAGNYYLARANALEDNVNLYYVQNGRRRELRGWSGRVSTGAWHELRADARGDSIDVYFDGARIISARDQRFRAAGLVGLWTKADSRTAFAAFSATPLQ